ncbi:DUF4229 domain-containing protein [Kocuria sp. JC486]|uniref:DUF4229 domain-containing protein n=1 Tax=Kocuria soli TaxID=2485125 RepID=A0A3N4AF87_9MICC|nr:DUF4229 domain-containing protein [Kocuria soli]NHU84663.1 DUF4229 domain-containing protein [Kocuria sp. JC486]ROZ65569.1 DUF4229 domain-containing protein [Kocuria soli]
MNFLKYSVLRLGLLVVVFVAGLYLRLGILFAGAAAIIIAFAVCYIFFPKLHIAASQDFHRRISRSPKIRRESLRDEDAEIEDAYVDSTDDPVTDTRGGSESSQSRTESNS